MGGLFDTFMEVQLTNNKLYIKTIQLENLGRYIKHNQDYEQVHHPQKFSHIPL